MKMKKKLLRTVAGLREDGINFKETPPLFEWIYDEEPTILFKLLIQEVVKNDVKINDTLQ